MIVSPVEVDQPNSPAFFYLVASSRLERFMADHRDRRSGVPALSPKALGRAAVAISRLVEGEAGKPDERVAEEIVVFNVWSKQARALLGLPPMDDTPRGRD
jgi:hypothetical protein